jgi:GTPase SAR1 family protein
LPTLYNHRAVASLGNIFLFGGVGSNGDEMVQFNDIYQFSDSFKLSPCPPNMSDLSAWQLLPNDILHHVFSFMEGEHLARSQVISRNVYQLLNRPYFKTQMKKCQFSIVGRDELKRKRFFVVLIGPSKSGKTSVVRRLVDKAYQGYVDVDLVWYQRDIKHEYGETNVDIYVPFSRQSLTATFSGLNYHNAEVGILLVCDVGDIKSLLHIRALLEELNSRQQSKVPTIILANKADLAEHVRQVSDEDLQNLSHKYNIPFMETSAKNNINIELAFQMITQQVFIHAAQKAIAQQNQRCDILQHKRCK